MEHAGGVHHQSGNAVDTSGCAPRQCRGPSCGFLVHGGATGHEGVELLGVKRVISSSARKVLGSMSSAGRNRRSRKFHFQMSRSSTYSSAGTGSSGWKNSRQPGARLVHVGKCTTPQRRAKPVSFRQRSCGGPAWRQAARSSMAARISAEEKSGCTPCALAAAASRPRFAHRHGRSHVFGLVTVVNQAAKAAPKQIRAATAVVQNQHGGIVFAGRHQQLQGKNGFAHCPDCRVCQRTARPKSHQPLQRFSVLIAACV